jgi:hypothetical protein
MTERGGCESCKFDFDFNFGGPTTHIPPFPLFLFQLTFHDCHHSYAKQLCNFEHLWALNFKSSLSVSSGGSLSGHGSEGESSTASLGGLSPRGADRKKRLREEGLEPTINGQAGTSSS